MRRNLPAVMLIIAAAVLIGAGVAAGQHSDVCAKAVRICMECVGLG